MVRASNVLTGIALAVQALSYASYVGQSVSLLNLLIAKEDAFPLGPDILEAALQASSATTTAIAQASTYLALTCAFCLLILGALPGLCRIAPALHPTYGLQAWSTLFFVLAWVGSANWAVIAVRSTVLYGLGERINCIPAWCTAQNVCDWAPDCSPGVQHGWWGVETYVFALAGVDYDGYVLAFTIWAYAMSSPALYFAAGAAACKLWPRRGAACLEVRVA